MTSGKPLNSGITDPLLNFSAREPELCRWARRLMAMMRQQTEARFDPQGLRDRWLARKTA